MYQKDTQVAKLALCQGYSTDWESIQTASSQYWQLWGNKG